METAPIYGVVYYHYCPASGKGYVGQTTDTMERRWYLHRKTARSPRTPGYAGAIARAIRKHGPAAFESQVLGVAASRAELDNLEKIWIILLQTKSPHGYNMTDGGDSGTPGHKVSVETRAVLRAKAKLQWAQPEFRSLYHKIRTGLKRSIENDASRVAARFERLILEK